MLKTHDHIFIRLDTIPERDGWTDGQTESLQLVQCSALHAMQMRGKNSLRHFTNPFSKFYGVRKSMILSHMQWLCVAIISNCSNLDLSV